MTLCRKKDKYKDVNFRAITNSFNHNGFTPVHLAVSLKDKIVLKSLCELNKDSSEEGETLDKTFPLFDLNIATRDQAQTTALHMACEIPSLSMIVDLCEQPSIQTLNTDGSLKFPLEKVHSIYLTSKKMVSKYTFKQYLRTVLYLPKKETDERSVFEHYLPKGSRRTGFVSPKIPATPVLGGLTKKLQKQEKALIMERVNNSVAEKMSNYQTSVQCSVISVSVADLVSHSANESFQAKKTSGSSPSRDRAVLKVEITY